MNLSTTTTPRSFLTSAFSFLSRSQALKTASPGLRKVKNYTLLKEEVIELYGSAFDKYLKQKIMGGDDLNTEGVKSLLKEFILQPRFAHDEIIKEGEPYFRCLDCEILKNTNQRTYYCRACFEKKSHKGHRFLLFNDATGYETCDCGNNALLDHRWFCPDHGTCTKEDYNRVISVIPPSYMKNFNRILKQVIYELTFVCEIYRKGLYGNIQSFLDSVVTALLITLKHCVNLNPIFIVLIAEIISSPMKHPKSFKKGFLFIEGKFVKYNRHIIQENLSMTFLENLLRYSPFFMEESQRQFRELLLKLACAEEFKKKLVLSYHKTVHHLFDVRPYNPFHFSDVAFLSIQIYASEQNCLKVVKEGSFDKITEVLRNYARNFVPLFDPESEVLARLLHPLELILEKENSGRQLVQKEDFVGLFLSVIAEFQRTHSYNLKSLLAKVSDSESADDIMAYWDFEEQLYGIIERIMRNTGYILDQIGWDKDPGLFLIDWGEKANEDYSQNSDLTKVHLNIPLQRAIMTYLQNILDRIDQNTIMNQLEYIRRSCPDAIEHLLGQAISTIGLMRQGMIRISEWNLDANSVVHRYFIQDGISDFSYFDYDFSFVQMFSMLLDEEETNMFELYYKNFLGNNKELIELFESADFEKATDQQMLIFEDFFNFLVQLLHGEISFFNIFYKSTKLTDHSSRKILDQVHRKILITFLHKTYSFFPITALKNDFRYILKKDIFHEKILKDIADLDRESKTFKLKKPYKDLFDAFYLYPDRIINDKIVLNVRSANKNPEIAELGNFTQNLPFLEVLQKRLYEGDLVNWIAKFFSKFSAKSTNLVPPIARLMMMPLKLLEHAKQKQLSRRFKEKVIITFFSTRNVYDSLKNAFALVEDGNVKSVLAKLINIFIPKSNIGNTVNSIIMGSEEAPSLFDGHMISMDPSELQKTLEAQNSLVNFPAIKEWDEGEMKCGICHLHVNLNSEDVGVPTYISRSNVNYWELKGRKFGKNKHNADKDTIALIIYLVKRYWPYATGLHPHDVDFTDGYVAPRLKLDFYPALTSCMHYLHRSCFEQAYSLMPGSAQEFECPICRKLNNTFIGMEKVDAASREILQVQAKQNKKFLNFLRKQGVLISMMPDPNLRFDFYNNFMYALFPKNSTLELRYNDPAADKKIFKFTSLMRTSFFQLVRNSMIYDFDTFMNRSYICYKFAFVNLQSFVMKNYQFHQFFEDFNNKLAPTVFHILNHSELMEGDEPPTMKQLYDVYKGAFGLDHEQEKISMKETKEKEKDTKKKTLGTFKPKKVEKHDHSKRLPQLPTDMKKKPFDSFKMNRRNKQIMMAYNYQQNVNRVNEMIFESQQILARSVLNSSKVHYKDTEAFTADMTGSFDNHYIAGRGKGSAPEKTEDYQEEELFDTLQKTMLLLESETEEDYLLAFWESFLRFSLTNRMKDKETNIDINMLAVDFLYLRTLGLFTRTLLSERVLRIKQHKVPDFVEMCKIVSENPELKAGFIKELLSITQRIVVSCVLIFDFEKCMEIIGALQFLSDLRGNMEMILNKLLGFLVNGLNIDVILSPKIFELSKPYKNFFAVWKENMAEFLKKTRNPFELFVKNITEIKPLMIELPSNFNEFNSEYLAKRCDICKEFCEYCKTVVCLLCGQVMCRDKCAKPPSKSSKDKKKKRRRKYKKRNVLRSAESSDTESCFESTSNEFEDIDLISAPVKPKSLTPKDMTIGEHKRTASKMIKVRVKTADVAEITRSPPIDIVVFNEGNTTEREICKTVNLPPLIREEYLTPLRPLRPIENIESTAEHTGNVIRTRRVRIPGIKVKSEVTLSTDTPTSIDNVLTARSTNQMTMDENTTERDRIGSYEDTESNLLGTIEKKKKRRRKIKHGNLHKHAEDAHKGHCVYIGIQDQSIILFSAPREVKYFEKLYVDKFGQTLSEKGNVFEEDWNSFEVNPFVLKKLRDAVENHSLPQLTFSIMNGEIKPNVSILTKF